MATRAPNWRDLGGAFGVAFISWAAAPLLGNTVGFAFSPAHDRLSVPLYALVIVVVFLAMGFVVRLFGSWPDSWRAMLLGSFSGGLVFAVVTELAFGAFATPVIATVAALLGGLLGGVGAATIGTVGFLVAAELVKRRSRCH